MGVLGVRCIRKKVSTYLSISFVLSLGRVMLRDPSPSSVPQDSFLR